MSARVPKRVPYFIPASKRRIKKDRLSAQLDDVIELLRTGQIARAADLAADVRVAAQREGSAETHGRATSLLAEAYAIRGDLAAAIIAYQLAIETLESTDLAGSIARAYRGLAHCYLTLRLPRLALEPANDSSRVATMIDQPETRDRALFESAICQGLVALDLLELDKAAEHHRSVEHLVTPLAPIDPWLPGLFHLLGGRVQIEQGRAAADRELFLDGLATLERVSSHFCDASLPYWEARTLEALGYAREAGDVDEAVRLVRDASAIYGRIGAEWLRGSSEQWLARVRPRARNRYADAPSRRKDVRLSPEAHIVAGLFIAGPKTRDGAELAAHYANQPHPVLITGESGTGKERVARMIHALGNRAAGPFIPVNCTTLQPTLVESTLFGHRRGSFTGAATDRSGLVADAAGGTLFLDEIGDLPLDVQPKLLRFLESGRILALGESIERPVDVRIIAATNRNLDAAVRAGTFREDLFYRINVLNVTTLPLRERIEEIPQLAQHLARSSRISMGGLNALAEYAWPGNVRQLRNVVVRAVTEAGGSGALVDREHIAESLASEPAAPMPGDALLAGRVEETAPADFPFMHADGSLRHGMTLHDAEREFQRYHIERAMARSGGNQTRAAEELGLKAQTMHIRAHKLGLV